jgi:predicted RNA binding protein YcfA (HicA-like mRNA interferase family)
MVNKRTYSSKELIKILVDNGFQIVRIRGSHCQLSNTATNRFTTVPYGRKDLPKGLIKAVSRQTGVTL